VCTDHIDIWLDKVSFVKDLKGWEDLVLNLKMLFGGWVNTDIIFCCNYYHMLTTKVDLIKSTIVDGHNEASRLSGQLDFVFILWQLTLAYTSISLHHTSLRLLAQSFSLLTLLGSSFSFDLAVIGCQILSYYQ